LRHHNTVHPIVQAFDQEVYGGDFRAPVKIGLSFTAHRMPQAILDRARASFTIMAAGSEWCRRLLGSLGLPAVTVPQGVDPLLFNSGRAEKELFRDRFVVFSGGKFEVRKGHDIVIAAYKIFQDRHPDAMLVAAWFNAWPETMDLMRESRHIRFQRR